MKSPPGPNPDSRWDNLVRQARTDATPSLDSSALLRTLHAATPARAGGWAAEFSALFASARVLNACFGTAGVLAVVTIWNVWDVWQALPWAQFALATGELP